jgi:flagellar assembly factor FliW
MTIMTEMPANPDAAAADQLVLTFVEPLPGFGDDSYTLRAIDDRGLLFALRSVSNPSLRFVLSPREVFFPQYNPGVESVVAGVLGGQDVDLLVMLTVGGSLAEATANLRAPVAVCRSTGRAVQVILDDDSYPMHQALIAA